MTGITGTWIRGGTSKCWVFETADIEATGLTPGEFLPRIYGSPDPRQLDGVGGATSTTSKAMLLTRGEDEDIDVVYTFAQVGIEDFTVDWGSNCGNCSSTAGLYAVENGWVELAEDVTYVRTHNTNSGQTIVQRVPTPGGALPRVPEAMIPGTVYPGYEVGLGFVDPGGRSLGRLLPTGKRRDELTVGDGTYPVTMLDAGAPAVILPAESLGLDQLPHGDWTEAVRPRLAELDQVRRAGAVAMGMVSRPEEAERAVPKLGIVGPSRQSGADIETLMLSMGQPHPAMPITGSVAMTLAVFTEGTYPAEFAKKETPSGKLRLRTPAGVLVTFADNSGSELIVGADRTARTLATATLHLPEVTPVLAG